YLVPTIIHDLLTCNIDNYDLSSLKKIGYAGAAMTKQLTEEVYKRLKPEIFVNHYGSTEVYTYSICNYLNEKPGDRKSTRLNSSHVSISYAVFCLKKKK